MRVLNFINILIVFILLCTCVFAQGPGMYAQNPTGVHSEVLAPGQVNRSYMGKIVTVQGSVREFQQAWNDRVPNSFYLQDATGAMVRAIYWDDVAQALGQERMPKPGQLLRISGQVTEFQGDLQIMITTGSDITDVSELKSKQARQIALSAIDKSMVTKPVLIQGKVEGIRPSWKERAPDIVTLTDGVGEVKVVYWADVKNAIPPQHLPEEGKNIIVEGWVDEYRGEIQVKVDSPYNIKRLDAMEDEGRPASGNGASMSGSAVGPGASNAMQPVSNTASQAPSMQMASANTSNQPPKNQNNSPQRNPFTGASSGTPAETPGQQSASSTMNTQGQSAPGPGFYPIDRAQSEIQGPPARPHVLLFVKNIQPNGANGQLVPDDNDLLSVTKEAVFVWVDYHESEHIAKQLNVSEVPTWIFYTAQGKEKARAYKALTPGEIREYLQKIR